MQRKLGGQAQFVLNRASPRFAEGRSGEPSRTHGDATSRMDKERDKERD